MNLDPHKPTTEFIHSSSVAHFISSEGKVTPGEDEARNSTRESNPNLNINEERERPADSPGVASDASDLFSHHHDLESPASFQTQRQLPSTSTLPLRGTVLIKNSGNTPMQTIPESLTQNQISVIKSRKRPSTSSPELTLTKTLDCFSLPNKRGRKPNKLDMKSKLEKSRQSARECRARKKLRYQYLEELVSAREKAIFSLREELEMYKTWCKEMDEGRVPPDMKAKMEKLEKKLLMPGDERHRNGIEEGDVEEDDDDTDDDEDSDEDDDDDEDDDEEGERPSDQQ